MFLNHNWRPYEEESRLWSERDLNPEKVRANSGAQRLQLNFGKVKKQVSAGCCLIDVVSIAIVIIISIITVLIIVLKIVIIIIIIAFLRYHLRSFRIEI